MKLRCTANDKNGPKHDLGPSTLPPQGGFLKTPPLNS